MNLGGLFNRALSGAAALGAIAACAAVAVVAAAFALYALSKVYIGASAAAAVVALVFALIAGIAAMVAASGAKGAKRKPKASEPAPPENLLARAVDLAKDHPFLAAGAVVAAGVLGLRNPIVITTLISALTQPRRPRP